MKSIRSSSFVYSKLSWEFYTFFKIKSLSKLFPILHFYFFYMSSTILEITPSRELFDSADVEKESWKLTS